MKITLVRHTKVVVDTGVCYGFTDVDVATSFPEEAEIVKECLAGKSFDAVFCSPLQRCRKLASACGYAAPIPDNRLKELNCGSWEMQRWEEITDPLIQEWYNDWINVPAGKGESFKDQYNRVAAFLNEIKKQDYHNVCLFTHGGVVRCALIYAGLLTFEDAFTPEVSYGSIHHIDIPAETSI